MNESRQRMLNIILALLISIVAWLYVVYNYQPMTDERYRDVPIQFTGEAELAARGFGISEVSQDSISVVLNQNRINTGNISPNDISVIADVSGAVEGDNGISLRITSPEGTTVEESDVKSISVKVEAADTRTMDVVVAYLDPEEINNEPLISELSADTVTVVGASSEVSYVDQVVAYVRSSELTVNEREFSRTLVAVDAAGNEMPHMIMYPGEVTFKARTGVTKSVPLKLSVVGESGNGYERKYSAPDTIVIKGAPEILSQVSEVENETVNLSNIYEDSDIVLSYYLPDGIFIANESVGTKLHVTVSKAEASDNRDSTQ